MNPLSDQDKKFMHSFSIAGKMVWNLSNGTEPTEILVFGCGTDKIPLFLRSWYPRAKIVAYDTDTEKIQKAVGKFSPLGIIDDSFRYTTQKPSRKFPFVVASHVLHHSPEVLAEEVSSFLERDGKIGVLDYDMKGFSKDDFFVRWGRLADERAELAVVGKDEAYRLHTSFGLDDCVRLMRSRGIESIGSGSRLTGFDRRVQPALHFYYCGSKN